MQKQIVNILSIDVEDYYMVSAFEKNVRFEDWDKYNSRVEQNTRRILSILLEFDAKATFFVLGWVGSKFPQLVKEIHNQGHEIASHGYAHRLIYNQTPEEFRQDIRKAKEILEQIINKPVWGYRAPSYSITKRSLWALDILIEEGFKYDSSIFPIYHNRGGIPNSERFIHKIKRNAGEIIEFPLTTAKILGYNMPMLGGGYFRFFPYRLTKRVIEKINKQNNSVVLYIHPWEIDPNQPKIHGDWMSMLKHYLNLDKTEKKLRKLLSEFRLYAFREFIIMQEGEMKRSSN